ncbi:MAG: helicase HerA domain-containing protein, partial [Candidatus Nanohaloarchaea archaeon]
RDYPVLVIDPHGEYHTLGRSNQISEEETEKYGMEEKGYNVKEYSTNTEVNPDAEKLSFSSRNLEAKELEQMVPTSLTNSQLEVLYNALKDLKKRDSYSLEDITDRAMEQDSKAKWNLVNILEIVQDSNMFSDDPTDPEDLVRSGEASIVNLKGVDPEQQEMVVYKLAKELFERRKRGELEPFIMVIEEAHNFVPERNFGKAVCSDVLRTIASEGRKFGLGLGVISQRPARVDKNVLSQCNTQLIMRVTNPNDLNAISRSFEGVTSEVKDFITSLPPGVGLLLGKEYPVMTDVRTRRSLHGGETKELSRGEKEQDEDEAELEEPEPPETRASSPEPEEKERGAGRIKSLEPSLSYDKLKEKSGEAEVAYYPVYLVRTAKGSAAVDASRGEIRYSESFSSGLESDILEILKRSERSRGKLMEALDVPLSELEPALETLKEEGAVREEESEYVYDGFPAFQEEAREVQPEDSHTIIDPEITEDEAARIASAEIGSEDVSVEKVYYPYFKSGEQVFDAVRAEEV